jgi:hypothetical protein
MAEAEASGEDQEKQPVLAASQPSIQTNRAMSTANEERIVYLDNQMRKRAASLLAASAVMGLCGIAVVTALGLHRVFTTEQFNMNGEPFPSGKAYFPACISEMVYDPDTPSGKAFIAFMLPAAIAMMISWYPYQLRNVFIKGNARPTHLCFSEAHLMPTWNDLRVFIPPIGLMLVALIQSTPEGLMGYRENIAEQIHANGAMAMIGSHCIFEFNALLRADMPLTRCERAVRWFLSICALLFGVGFAITCQLYSRATDLGICCKDVWETPGSGNAERAIANEHVYVAEMDYHRMEYGKKMLVDTAHDWALGLKYMEFFCEVLSVFFFALGLLAMWFFCEERNVEYSMGELPLMHSAGGEDGRIVSASSAEESSAASTTI